MVTYSKNAQRLIGIGTPVIKEAEGAYDVQVELSLPGDVALDSVRAHVIASAFIYNITDPVANIRKTLTEGQVQTHRLTGKKCSYLSNKQLSD